MLSLQSHHFYHLPAGLPHQTLVCVPRRKRSTEPPQTQSLGPAPPSCPSRISSPATCGGPGGHSSPSTQGDLYKTTLGEREGRSFTRQRWVRIQGHERPKPSSSKGGSWVQAKSMTKTNWTATRSGALNEDREQTSGRPCTPIPRDPDSPELRRPPEAELPSPALPPTITTNGPGTPTRQRFPRFTSASLQPFLLFLT